jgi:RNA polymerase sigma factor (sigma-70 family)
MPELQLPAVIGHIRKLAADSTRQMSDAQLLQRFSRHREEAAFAALVHRHGGLVFSVCRRVLRQEQDAEDAFQATFLALARHAGALRVGEAVGAWLYRVAYRIAAKAGGHMARRRSTEKHAPARPQGPPDREADCRELEAVVQQELERMPEKLRGPFVLCCLEGKTRSEAAVQLGWKEGTVGGRLAQARKHMQQRLSQRGLTLSTVLCLAALGRTASAAPSRLGRQAIRAALCAAAGGAADALVPMTIATLAEGVHPTMLTGKLKSALTLLLALGVAAGIHVRASFAARAAEEQQAGAPGRPGRDGKTKDAANTPASTVSVKGEVLGPGGKPVAGARLYLRQGGGKESASPLRATSDRTGRFSFTFGWPKGERQAWAQVIAVAGGQGPDWALLRRPAGKADLTLRLTKEAPIRGRLLDIDGKAVAGATLRVEYTHRYPGDDLRPLLRTVREGEFPPLPAHRWEGPFPGQPKTLVTGADGRFRLPGVGAGSEVRFHVEGAGIQYGHVRAVARDLKAAVEPKGPGRVGRPHVETVHGASFTHAVAPSRPIRGVVRDRRTAKAVAGVRIGAPPLTTTHHAVTDKDGRYELKGYPKSSAGYQVHASPGGLPYFNATVHLPDTPGLGPVAADIDLVGGIAVRGRVTHQATGKPVAGAWVDYRPLFPNPHVARLGLRPGQSGASSSATTGPDGGYSLVVLPGPGALGVGAYLPAQPLMPACVTEQDLKDFFKDALHHGTESALMTQEGPQTMGLMGQNRYNSLTLIRPDEKAKALRHDVALRPERTLRGKVVGPDGKPLKGVRVHGLEPQSAFGAEELKEDAFVVRGFNPRRKRELVFTHPQKQLGAFLEVRGESGKPLVVRLQACGSITGRILDRDGQPVPDLVVRVDRRLLMDSGPKVKTDGNGRFHVNGLVPGQKYDVRLDLGRFGRTAFGPIRLAPGEHKDLGKARVDTTKRDD